MAGLTKAEARKDHLRLLIDTMDDMRQTKVHTDVVLMCCRGEEFDAHKLILCAGSPYFRAMFQSGMVEATSGQVNLTNLEAEAVDVILTFLYTGKIRDIGEEKTKMKAVLAASHLLEICLLFQHFWQAYSERLSPENFADVWNTAELYENQDMLDYVPRFIAENFNVSSNSSDFKELHYHQLKKLLITPLLKKCRADTIVKGILLWIKHDIAGKKQYLPELLTLVDLEMLSNEYLARVLNEEDLVRGSVELLNMFLYTATHRLVHKNTANVELQFGETRPRMLVFYQNKDESYVVAYKYMKQTWTAPKQLPFSIPYGCALTVHSGQVYFFGSKDESYHRPATNMVLRYDPYTNNVHKMKNMKVARHAAGAGVLQGKIYVVGGWMFGPLHTVERYDPQEDVWEEMASTEESHYSPNMITFGEDLYVVGSLTSSRVEQYDALENQWTVVTSVPQPIGLQLFAAACMDKIYIIGKEGKVFRLYDPATSHWYEYAVIGGPEGVSGIWSCHTTEAQLPFILMRDDKNVLYEFNPETSQWNQLPDGVDPSIKIQETVLLFV